MERREKDDLVATGNDDRIQDLIARRQSDTIRWSRPVSVDRLWLPRARIAAAMIPARSRVLDLGCGAMALRDCLPAGCVYIPADIVKRSEETHLIELNAGQWPAVTADVVTALGVLEYLYDPVAFMTGARACGPVLVVTYHVRADESAESGAMRLRMAWLSDFRLSDLVRAAETAGGAVTRLTAMAPKRYFRQYVIKIVFPPPAAENGVVN